MYLSQLAAAAVLNQGQNGSNGNEPQGNEPQEEVTGESNKAETAASISSEVATSSCGAESPLSPRPFGTVEREVDSSNERNSVDNAALRF